MFLAALVPPEIVITGRGLAEPDDPSRHEIVIEQPLADSASGRFEDVLADVAGLTVFRRSDSRSASPTTQGFTLRGLGGNAAARGSLTIDGVPQADPLGGWLNFSAIELGGVDRIRIVRGGGVDGAVGSIDIDTSEGLGSAAALAVNDREGVDGHARFGTEIGKARLIMVGGWQTGDGFIPIVEEDRGPADREAAYQQATARARLLAPLGNASLQANVSFFEDERERGFAGSDNRARGIDASLRMVGDDWSLTGYWQDRAFRNAFAALDDDRATTRPVLDQYSVPSTGVGAVASYRFDAGPARWQVGADLRRVEGSTNERYFFVGDTPTRERQAGGNSLTGGIEAKGLWSLGTVTLESDVRLDRWRISDGRLFERQIDGGVLTDVTYDDRSGTEWSGRLGLSHASSDKLTLRAALSRGWRLPTLNELYRPFRIGADAFAANALLAPEVSEMAEVGIDIADGPFSFSATLFAARLKDAVSNVPLGSGPGVFPGAGFVNGTYSQRRNLDAIDSRGVELDGRWSEGPWSARLSYAFTDAEIVASGDEAGLDGLRTNQVPRHAASLALSHRTESFATTLIGRYEGARFDEVDNQVRLPDAFTLDAIASVAVTPSIDLSLRAENLFDAQVIAGIDGRGTRERARPRAVWIELAWRS